MFLCCVSVVLIFGGKIFVHVSTSCVFLNDGLTLSQDHGDEHWSESAVLGIESYTVLHMKIYFTHFV